MLLYKIVSTLIKKSETPKNILCTKYISNILLSKEHIKSMQKYAEKSINSFFYCYITR